MLVGVTVSPRRPPPQARPIPQASRWDRHPGRVVRFGAMSRGLKMRMETDTSDLHVAGRLFLTLYDPFSFQYPKIPQSLSLFCRYDTR